MNLLLIFGRFFHHIHGIWAHIKHMYMYIMHMLMYTHMCPLGGGPSKNEQKTKKLLGAHQVNLHCQMTAAVVVAIARQCSHLAGPPTHRALRHCF